jgi:hypothetical protein
MPLGSVAAKGNREKDSMTTDERIDRLVERHEALAQSVELLAIEGRELAERIKEQGENIDKLLVASKQDGENILALAHIAELHERRLSGLEGGAQ